MLRFITKDRNFYGNDLIFLTDMRSVETEFIFVLNWNKDAFKDKESLKLMKDIDSATRKGDYGVVTPIGKSCISCLSTGCKFGLLVLFYRKFANVKLMVEISVAGNNVWNWLAKNIDYEVYIYKEDMSYELESIDNVEVLHEAKVYKKNDTMELWDVISECKSLPYDMTKEMERVAYDKEKANQDKRIHCPLKEEVSIVEFVKRFPDGENFLCDEEYSKLFGDYMVVNYCSYILNDFLFRKLPIYLCVNDKGSVKFHNIISVKYPTFLELLFYDILECSLVSWNDDRQIVKWYGELFESWFALVLNGNEQCKVKEYPRETHFGIEVNVEKKIIIIYDKEQAIERFHALYEKSEMD